MAGSGDVLMSRTNLLSGSWVCALCIITKSSSAAALLGKSLISLSFVDKTLDSHCEVTALVQKHPIHHPFPKTLVLLLPLVSLFDTPVLFVSLCWARLDEMVSFPLNFHD